MISSAAAKVHAQKLLRYIEEVSATRPYSQTQSDLAEIYSTCSTIQRHITDTLIKCGSLQLIRPADRTEKSTKSDRRIEIAKFGNILQKMSEMDLPFVEASRCARLLSTWYHHRFLNDRQSESNFRYNINHVKDWARAIVLAYGHSIAHGDESTFIDTFNSWCKSLDDPNTSNYPLPYSVYQFQKNLTEDKMSAVSLVLWDVLMDYGLQSMSASSCSHIYFTSNDLLDLCHDVCPRVAHWHTHYELIDPDGIQLLKLHKRGGDTL